MLEIDKHYHRIGIAVSVDVEEQSSLSQIKF